MTSARDEIEAKSRFEFGRNWSQFLRLVDPERIERAERSLREALLLDSLAGRSFVDVGCGSGLFSLAARRLGARVHSFDYDPESVACAAELRARYDTGARDWKVEQGSALDAGYLASLGSFDVVYSWGVLHHTGQMWEAMDLVSRCVAPGGLLLIALYNDQGIKSRFWRLVKRIYVSLPRPLRSPYAVLVMAPFELRRFLKALWAGTPRAYFSIWSDRSKRRGMNRWHDVIDWVGGYPYEVARPADVRHFYAERGFEELRSRLTTDNGCNEFLFRRRNT